MDASAISSRLIGTLLVEKGLITEAQLELALEEQQTTGERLGEILMLQFGVTRTDLENALTAQRAENQSLGAHEDSEANAAVRELARMLDEWGRVDEAPQAPKEPPKRPIGEIFVERGFITSGQLEEALEEQKWSGRKLGEILVAQGKLSRLRLWDALEDQASSFEETPTGREAGGAAKPSLRVVSDALTGHVPEHEARGPVEMWQPSVGPPLQAEPVPSASDEAIAGLREEIAALAARLDALPRPTEEWREAVSRLGSRVDELADALRQDVGSLRAGLDALPPPTGDFDELADRLATLDENVTARLQHVTNQLAAAATREQAERLRRELDDLRAALDALPAPTDDVDTLARRVEHLSESFSARLQQISDTANAAAGRDQADALRHDLGSLSARIDELAAGSGEVRSALDHVHARIDAGNDNGRRLDERLDDVYNRLESIPVPTEEWREAIAALAVQIDSAQSSDEWRDAVAALAVRLDEVAGPAEELRAELERHNHRLEHVDRRLEELAPLHRVDELANATAETASAHGAALDSIREELSAHARKVQELVEKRRADKATFRERLDAVEATVSNGPDVGAMLEPLQAQVSDLDHRLSELASQLAAERRAELDAMRDELLRAAADRFAADGEALDFLRHELTGAVAEWRREADALRSGVYDRIEQVAATSADRAELDALRGRLEAEITELLERQGQDGAAVEATGQAIRDGLAELARRLTSSEDAYLESGRALRRSIEGLGLAITDADWHLRTGTAGEPDEEASSYVAFAPAGDAYRLVECNGPPPYLGQIVDIEGFEDATLRVSRLGRSPLPFDGRPCAYLERLSA